MTTMANLTNTVHCPQTLNSSEPIACKMHKHKINSRKPSQRCLSSPTTPIHEQIPHFQHPPRTNEAMPEQKTFVKFPYTNQSDQSIPPNHGMRSSGEKSIQSSGSSSSSSAGATRNVPLEISESRMKSGRPVSASSPYFTRSARIDQSGLRIFNQSQSSTKPAENGSLATLVANRSRDATYDEDSHKATATETSIQSLNNASCDLQMTQPSSMALLRTSLPKYCRPPIFTKEKAPTQLTPTSYTKRIRDRQEDEADTVHASLINSYDAQLLSWSASNAEEKPNPGLTSASNELEELDTNTWPSKAGGFVRRKNRNTVTCGEELSKVKTTCVQPREPTKSHDPSETRDGEGVRRRAENLCQLSRFTSVINSQQSLTNRTKTRPLSGGLFQPGTMTDPSGEARIDHLFSFVMSSGKQEMQTSDRYFMSNSETGPSNVGRALRMGHDSELALMASRSDASRESSTSRGLLPNAKQVNPTKLLSTAERYNTLPWSQRNLFKNEHTSNASEKTDGVKAHLENEVGRVQNLASTALSCTQRRIPTEGGPYETPDRQQDPSSGGTISAPPGTPIKLPYAPPSYRLHQTLESHSVRGTNVEGSTLSLSSNTSNISVVEQNPDDEIKLLRKKLQSAQSEISLLTSQLVMNAQVVSAFEQSLNSISQRLKNLTTTTARKDSELHELRATIDALRCQSGFGLHSLGNQQLLVTGNQVVLGEATTPFQQVPQSASVHVPAIDETVNTQPDGKPNDANQRKSSW
ncbi:neuron navigator 2, partial [Clonorchis sinensis]